MKEVTSNTKLLMILLIISILLLIADKNRFLIFPKNIISYITTPVSFGLFQTGRQINSQFYFIFHARFAAQENKALTKQNSLLSAENATLRKQVTETQALLSQEKYLDPLTYKLIPARLIGIGKHLKLDIGLSSGVKIGQAVVFNDNYVGKITQLSENQASVLPLADPDSKVAAFSQGLEGKAKGVLIGQFGNDLLLDKILHEENIGVGDLVYSEGTEGFLPRGLVLGKVVQVLERENEVFKQAKIKPNFDIFNLEVLFVIDE